MHFRLPTVLNAIWRLITFRLTREEFLRFDYYYLVIGLLCTWLAGIGRTLHNPRVEWWQHLGLGSVAYVFVLSVLLWILLFPLRIENLSWRNVLTFIAMVSPTGFIYAIPVESYLSFEGASSARVWFLAIVAGWRVALWAFYLMRFCRLSIFACFSVCLLPLCVIINVLAMLNLSKIVFDFMRSPDLPPLPPPITEDGTFFFLLILTALSQLSFIPLSLFYFVTIYFSWVPEGAQSKSEMETEREENSTI